MEKILDNIKAGIEAGIRNAKANQELIFKGENNKPSGSVCIHGSGVVSLSHGVCEAIYKQFPSAQNFIVEVRITPKGSSCTPSTN